MHKEGVEKICGLPLMSKPTKRLKKKKEASADSIYMHISIDM